MRIIFIVLFIFFFNIGFIEAAVLRWTRNPLNTDIVAYKVFWGAESGNYTDSVDVGNVTYMLMDDIPIGNYISITTINKFRIMSTFSEEIQYTEKDAPFPLNKKPVIKQSIEFE